MNSGDLVLFRGRGFIPWVIRVWTRSRWGHCGVLWICEGQPLVIEARFGMGVSAHALANRMDDFPEVFPTGRPMNLALGLSQLGDWYSVKDALRASIGLPAEAVGYECAELAADLLGLGGHEIGWTPQRLANALFLPGGRMGTEHKTNETSEP